MKPADVESSAGGAGYSTRVAGAIADVDAAAWDALDHGPSPFLRHGFLAALEASGSVGGRSGWTPRYVLVEEAGQLVGATAAYVKGHSYGEYIFDWGWARAAERAGVPYYPKLVIAAPMTPATGPRALLAPGRSPEAQAQLLAALIDGVRGVAEAERCRSIHWLFCTEAEQAALAAHGLLPRASLQFHWHNRGYRSFDGFLDQLTSRKRKQLRKERARAQAAIDGLRWLAGDELDDAVLGDLDRWYRSTVDAHGGSDYLRPGVFQELARRCADTMRVVEVRADGARVAGALFFETAGGLYGRYWGADRHVDLLHFETAYYAGIDRCIERGLPLFEAGAQGEHKLLRGFEPAMTRSAHEFVDPGLSRGVAEFLRHERAEVARQLEGLAAYGPYKHQADAAASGLPSGGDEVGE
jgi:predicted N-acyltransferase